MKLQMHSIHFDADQKLLEFIQKKVDKLEKFYDQMIDGEVFLKVNNSKIENKTVEIKLNLPGDQIFAKEQAKTFEEGTDLACEALRRQLRKKKPKQNAA